MLYTSAMLTLLDAHPGALHMLSHVTGGGLAQNLSRVLPPGMTVDVDRSTWTPPVVMQVLAEAGGFALAHVEDTWNMGVGMVALVDSQHASAVIQSLQESGHRAWKVGVVERAGATAAEGSVTSAKGVEGGAVRLVGTYADSSSASS
jgi:phosphoribosylformylglycinamidine cyclo-ligase